MLVTDPRILDDELIAEAIERKGIVPRIQFSNPAACTAEMLARVNACCRRFGAKVSLRFFGFYKTGLDLRVLEQIPELRSLIVDVHVATNLKALRGLTRLEDLGIGVLEEDNLNALEFENLLGLRRLTLLPTRKSNVNLAPLEFYRNLEDLILCGHGRNINVLAKMGSVRKLGLSGIGGRVRLDCVRAMEGLESLWMVLGGRSSTEEFANPGIERLRIDRVRGMGRIDLSGFPRLVQLCLEDQIGIGTIDVLPLTDSLRRVQIFNLRMLEELQGFEKLARVEAMWLGQTKIDPELMIERLPPSVRKATFAGYGKNRDARLKEMIQLRGLEDAKYDGSLGR